ncbi:MAG: hypothetical protein M0Q54_11140 [Pigmentiphaga sp.]|nr:hypothetical protein [Pigmentiphaga sp.]
MKRAVLGMAVLGLGVAAFGSASAQTAAGNGQASTIPGPARVEPAQVIGNAPPSASTEQAGISFEAARALAEASGATGQAAVPAHQRRRIVRGRPLPTDVQFQRPPAEMLLKLPVHRGFEWRVVGWDLVLIKQISTVVNDIVFDVFK